MFEEAGFWDYWDHFAGVHRGGVVPKLLSRSI